MAEKVTIMRLKVDLQCEKCYKKVKKVLCKFPQIRDQVFDEKQNIVTIKVVCCSPEKIRDKLCCKGCGAIKSIEIMEPPKPKSPEPEKPKPPKPAEPEKPKPEKPAEPEKPKPEKPKPAPEKPKEPEKPKPPPEKPKEPEKPKPQPPPPLNQKNYQLQNLHPHHLSRHHQSLQSRHNHRWSQFQEYRRQYRFQLECVVFHATKAGPVGHALRDMVDLHHATKGIIMGGLFMIATVEDDLAM